MKSQGQCVNNLELIPVSSYCGYTEIFSANIRNFDNSLLQRSSCLLIIRYPQSHNWISAKSCYNVYHFIAKYHQAQQPELPR
jgi:hypothetical protein